MNDCTAKVERDAAERRRDAAKVERDAAERRRDAAKLERDAAERRREAARVERDTASGALDKFEEECASFNTSDRWKRLKAIYEVAQAALAQQQAALAQEQAALAQEQAALAAAESNFRSHEKMVTELEHQLLFDPDAIGEFHLSPLPIPLLLKLLYFPYSTSSKRNCVLTILPLSQSRA
jgi:hypothetical protein